MKSAMRPVISVALLLLAAVLGALHLLAVVDPVGTKMADSGDPFGDPSIPLSVHPMYFAVEVTCVLTAVYLFRRKRRAGG